MKISQIQPVIDEVGNKGIIYTNNLFDVGEFIYLDRTKKYPKYRKALEGFCDFLVISKGSNYIEVCRNGFIELDKNSNLTYSDRILGDVYLDINGLITTEKTKTYLGYIDNKTFHIQIETKSNNSGNTGVGSLVYEYSSEGPIIDTDVYFLTPNELYNKDFRVAFSDLTINSASVILEGVGVRNEISNSPLKFSVIIERSSTVIGNITFDVNDSNPGKYALGNNIIFCENSDLNISVLKGASISVKFNNSVVEYGTASTVVYYRRAKLVLNLTED